MRTKSMLSILGMLLAMMAVPAQAETPSSSSTTGISIGSSVQSLTSGFSSLPGQLAAAVGLTSDNVEYVTTIPIDSPGVSAKIRDHLETPLLFASGVKGLSIYDISDPASPTPVGFLPLPHSQNEDVQVSEDGTRVIIAADGNLPAPNPITVGLHVIDTSDPSSPAHVAWLDGSEGANHTAACADAACDWIYGSSGGIFEVVTDEDGEVTIERQETDWFEAATQIEGQDRLTRSHALNRSVHPDPETGEAVNVLTSDSTPRLMMDVNDPANPVVLTSSGDEDVSDDGFLQHNNQRPNSQFWTPRDGETGNGDTGNGQETRPGRRRGGGGPPDGAPGERGRNQGPSDDGNDTDDGTNGIEPFEVSGNASGQRTAEWGEDWEADGVSGGYLRPGELMIGNSESNIVPQCTDSSGGLTTWDVSDFDKGEPMRIIDQFRPVNSAPNSPFEDGNPPANGLGCSGHWFDIQDGDNLIAASWYEHGIKIIEIDENYSMNQIGYFQPIGTEAGSAYWVVDRDTGEEYIYSMDYARGLDVIRFHRDAAPASETDMAASFWRAANRVDVNPSYYLYYKRNHHDH
jgi:hypothetical protein